MARRPVAKDILNHPERFSELLYELSEGLCDEVAQKAAEILYEVSTEAAEEVKATAPVSRSLKGTGGHHLKDAFRLDAIGYKPKSGKGSYAYGVPAKFVVHAPKWHKYSIIHLLEKGHLAKGFDVSKPFVQGRPFMVPAQERAKQKIIERLKRLGLNEQ